MKVGDTLYTFCTFNSLSCSLHERPPFSGALSFNGLGPLLYGLLCIFSGAFGHVLASFWLEQGPNTTHYAAMSTQKCIIGAKKCGPLGAAQTHLPLGGAGGL
jgi:hypothetical protein